jgi:non-specific serine/threonine protein kinase
LIGQTIGRYRIVSKLGAGGMGEVFLADDTELERQVALKFLPVSVAGDAEVLERFKREAKAAAALDHPNIITVHEIGEHKGRAFIVMSYVEGELLSDAIARKDLSIDRALQIALQICDGLAKAHQAGIVHRDMKPDNVALDEDGNVKILDFGLAKLGDVTRLTKEDSTVGTLYYMSPEQARGDDVDARTDLFSVGAMLYEMITGRRAFEGDHAAAVHYSIANEDPQPMSRFNNKVTPELDRIVSKLLSKDVGARYQTAADAMADIRSLRTDTGEVHATGSGHAKAGVSPAVTAPKSGRRRGLWIGSAALAVVAVLVVLFNPFSSGGPSSDEARPMVVVLPFENLGEDEEEYFADGITDEITSRLATITGLGVISRTSAMRYKNSNKSVAEIADELKVTHILEGTIRWDKSGEVDVVRITPQLIRTSDDTHLWADNYQRDLERIFEVQADIATHIAQAMEVTVLDKDLRTIEAVPTENTEAYKYYLRGLEYTHAGSGLTTGNIQIAIDMFNNAVELDPGFAEAWAMLGTVHANYYHNGVDRTPARLAMAKEAVERAIALGPNVAEARLAMGLYHYWGLKDYDNALAWLEKAAEIRSGHKETIQSFGWVLRRLGRYEEATEYLKETLKLDPQDMGTLIGLGELHATRRDMEPALGYFRQVVELYPDETLGYFYVAMAERKRGNIGRPRHLRRIRDP